MLFTDGECPLCGVYRLHLNESDLLECPNCNLMISAADVLAAAVLPVLGEGRFRLEDSDVRRFAGALVTRTQGDSPIPDYKRPFKTVEDLQSFRTSIASMPKAHPSISETLAKHFLQAFRDSLLRCDADKLFQAWPSKPERTRLYSHVTMPEIAAALRLTHLREKFTVDHALVRLTANDHAVPQIYIESENDYNGARHEIQKLCSLNSPVRVLVTATPKEFLGHPSGGAYAQLREWQSIVRSHHADNSQFDGILLIIVGRQTSHSLRFDACAFHPNGDLVIPLTSLLERNAG